MCTETTIVSFVHSLKTTVDTIQQRMESEPKVEQKRSTYSPTRISAQNVYQLLEQTPPRKEVTQFCVMSFHVGVRSNN